MCTTGKTWAFLVAGSHGYNNYRHQLHAIDLTKTIENMHTDKRFAKLLFYMETCYSGSMFEGLQIQNMNVLAVTAANATEPSYACYDDCQRKTYLGDVFSVL
uniref:Legumain-like n=1 Tax=Crassostrea virginica TaxID=6565 RepID=A0A8B8DSH7_CRAVI|nr:legumain-like [Crassostrea virginica]